MRVVVVGSGVVGAACAYAATRMGADVLLADAGLPGQATAAGAGIVCPWTSRPADDPVWYDFACASARYYPGLIDDLAQAGETDVGYRQVGALLLAQSRPQQEQVHRHLDDRRAAAPEAGEVAALSGAQARDLFPPLRGDWPAVWVSGACRVDGRRLAGGGGAGGRARPRGGGGGGRAGREEGKKKRRGGAAAPAGSPPPGPWTTQF